MDNDPVNHPSHYTQYKREVIDLTEKLSFCVGNAVKYILRAPYKGREVEDLQKAMWYVERSLRHFESVPQKAKEVAKVFENPLVDMLLECYPTKSYGRVYAYGMEKAKDALRAAIADAKAREEAARGH